MVATSSLSESISFHSCYHPPPGTLTVSWLFRTTPSTLPTSGLLHLFFSPPLNVPCLRYVSSLECWAYESRFLPVLFTAISQAPSRFLAVSTFWMNLCLWNPETHGHFLTSRNSSSFPVLWGWSCLSWRSCKQTILSVIGQGDANSPCAPTPPIPHCLQSQNSWRWECWNGVVMCIPLAHPLTTSPERVQRTFLSSKHWDILWWRFWKAGLGQEVGGVAMETGFYSQ